MGIKVEKRSDNQFESGTLEENINYQTPEKENDGVIGYRVASALPSNYVPYDVDEIYFRGFNIGEIKTLNSNKNNTSADFFMKVIKDVIKGVEPKEVTLTDAKAILIQSMMISVGDVKWTYNSYCPECGYENVKEITVEDLDFQELKAPSLPVKSTAIKFNGKDVKFDAFRIKHLIEAEKYTNRNKKADMESVMLAAISNIRPLKDAVKFFSEMPVHQMNILKQINDILFHDINPIDISCSNKSAYVVLSDEMYESNKDLFLGLQKKEILDGVRVNFGTNDIKRQKLLKKMDESGIAYTEKSCEEKYIKTLDITLESLTPSDQPRGHNESTISFGEDD